MTENAPEEIELRVCEVCGKTDRYQHLAVGSYHFRDSGHRCDGDVVRLTYRRLAEEPPPSDDADFAAWCSEIPKET